MICEIIVGSVIANWWTGATRNTHEFVSEQYLNSVLSTFKAKLNNELITKTSCYF